MEVDRQWKMMQTEIERLRSCLSGVKERDFSEYSIYWGKKSQSVATAILNEFAQDGFRVIDPFLGSGSTIYGALNSQWNLDLIGTDVNEQPIHQAIFNLEHCEEKSISAASQLLKSFIDKNLGSYKYSDTKGREFVFQKARVNIVENMPVLQEIWLKDDESISAIDRNNPEFDNFEKQYRSKQASASWDIDLELPVNSRIAVKSGMKISNLYSPINFNILLELRELVATEPYLNGVLSSVLHLCKYTDKGSQSQFPFWYPKVDAYERNILDLIQKKHGAISRHVKSRRADSQVSQISSTYFLSQIPIQNLSSKFESKTFDLVITDPPYFDQVAYSEYLITWEFFTGSKVDLQNEIVESNRVDSNKNRERYLSDMTTGFKSLREVSKDNSLMFLYYKDARLGNIEAILRILAESGWKFKGQMHIDRRQFTYKQNASKRNTVEGDCLMVLEAQVSHEIPEPIKISPEDLVSRINELAHEYLAAHGASTLSTIYDNVLVPFLFSNGLLGKFKSPGDIVNILEEQFETSIETRKMHVRK